MSTSTNTKPVNQQNAFDAQVALDYAKQCLEVLLRESSLELAEMVVTEEVPTDSELPEQGLTRWVYGIEVVTRALVHLRTAREFLVGREAPMSFAESEAAE